MCSVWWEPAVLWGLWVSDSRQHGRAQRVGKRAAAMARVLQGLISLAKDCRMDPKGSY